MTDLTRQNSCKQILRSLVFLIAGLSVGCGTIDPQPFAKFSTAVQELRSGADVAVAATTEENAERFVAQVVDETGAGESDTLVDFLFLDADPPFGWKYGGNEAPLYVESQRFRAGIQTLNAALVRYSALLIDLAAPDLVDKEDFDEMAKDLNGNLTSAAKQLGVEDADKGLALFSAAAATAAHAYIDGQRRAQLESILEETQGAIDALSRDLMAAMRLAAQNTTRNYQHQRGVFSEAIGAAIPADGDSNSTRKKKAEERRKQVEGLMSLNTSYTGRLEALGLLSHAYSSLPTAHRELLQKLDKPGFDMATVKNLYATGKDLRSLYKELAPKSTD